jgi:hypothetical protein
VVSVRWAALKPALLVLWALASALAAPPAAVREAEKAVYNLWVLHNNRMAVICTGTVVSTEDGPRFLSAGHCVSDWPRARFYVSRSANPDRLFRVDLAWWEFEGIWRWSYGDFAVFKLPETFKPEVAIPICKELPEPGEDVWSWTGPLGMLPVLRTGVYSGEIHFPDSPEDEEAIGGMLLVDINGAPGSSGSGLLRMEEGRVCVFGIWAGAFTVGRAGTIVSPIPKVLR